MILRCTCIKWGYINALDYIFWNTMSPFVNRNGNWKVTFLIKAIHFFLIILLLLLHPYHHHFQIPHAITQMKQSAASCCCRKCFKKKHTHTQRNLPVSPGGRRSTFTLHWGLATALFSGAKQKDERSIAFSFKSVFYRQTSESRRELILSLLPSQLVWSLCCQALFAANIVWRCIYRIQ